MTHASPATSRTPSRTRSAGSSDKRKAGARTVTEPKGKLVYAFGGGKAEGNEDQKALLGGKGANLHGMTRLGLPVPPGFTITTEVCAFYYQHTQRYPKVLEAQVKKALAAMERQLKRSFGASKNPLLVSVRSGARASMPGMMDTILNLGLNDQTVEALARDSGNPRFAYDSYRRLIAMYSDVVLDVHGSHFEAALEDLKHERGLENDTELTAADWKALIERYKKIIRANGKQFPENPWEQLWGAIGAVFGSWMSPRAITYRRLNEIPEAWGTAVNIQAMVFGNLGDDCATGVAFTRDPATGEKNFFGEFLINAQGEDVVAGIRTPQPINEASRQASAQHIPTLEKLMPKAYRELVKVYQRLETHYRDMQDIEFTIERGTLFMLQTRTGKRTANAALRMAVEMAKEKLITKSEAVLRVKPEQLDQMLHPSLDPSAGRQALTQGLPASPGAAAGQIVFDPDTAEQWVKDRGRKVILVRVQTSPEDIHGMSVAEGILTATGGMTSHAAVVARGMGKPAICSATALKISPDRKELSVNGRTFKQGDLFTIDGASGLVYDGKIPTITPTLTGHFGEFMTWVDEVRTLGVRANADTPADAAQARKFGAEGIGLCRTEHMFFESDRIDAVREMILADDHDGRQAALAKILPMQRKDFTRIFSEMRGLPVTIRLLDPPLHEFIPHTDAELEELASRLQVAFDRLKRKAESLHEFNPMLGHRGCRLGVSFPEIYDTQVRAIAEAACDLQVDDSLTVIPEIMIPLVGDRRELSLLRERAESEIARTVSRYVDENGKPIRLQYRIGTMIELPRAALLASEIAEAAEFFSFGTNDLTQTTYGLSRDDSGTILKDYLNAKILDRDPFAALDRAGVGRLMRIATEEGRRTRPELKIGICGEHGGEPSSIEFCHQLGLDYVSCSPFRVPIARLAAAHAALTQLDPRQKGVNPRLGKGKKKTTRAKGVRLRTAGAGGGSSRPKRGR